MNWAYFVLLIQLGRVRCQYGQFNNGHEIDNSQNGSSIVGSATHMHQGYKYSQWTSWSKCREGSKTRRRHCLRRHLCGDSLRIEISRCDKNISNRRNENDIDDHLQDVQNRHLDEFRASRDIFRGFSLWGSWSLCSTQCISVRKRYCLTPSVCGFKVIRQSAYCYVEGNICHQWITNRTQKRRDKGYTIVDSYHRNSPIQTSNHKESKIIQETGLSCGILGQYIGSPSQRKRARMREMTRIIGGRQAPPGKWPWQVAVLNKYKEVFCGGTLVSLYWVVTAAHCVRRRLYVRLGEHDLLIRGYGELEMKVAEVIIHPLYDHSTVVNDLAMLRLPSPARPDLGHGIACLPEPHQTIQPHMPCTILGWGKKRPTDVHGTRVLQEAQVSTIPQAVCRRSYWQYSITDSMVCAGRGRRDSCAGDSGGPLLCKRRNDHRYYLQGITSFGDGCGKIGKYGIYTKVTAYTPWIKHIINKRFFRN